MIRTASILTCVMVGFLILAGCSSSKALPVETAKDLWGVWAVADHDGDLFDIVVYPNGTAATNWSKGKEGAKGQTGTWKAIEEGIEVTYPDGWRDVIKRTEKGLIQEGYAPENKEGLPTSVSLALRVTEPRAKYVGVWLTPELETGDPLYIAVFSDGTALKSFDMTARGTWTTQYGNAWFDWSDGWHHRILRTETGYVDEVWTPTQTPEMTEPAYVKIQRVGDPSNAAASPKKQAKESTKPAAKETAE